jgi:hypothetical protein
MASPAVAASLNTTYNCSSPDYNSGSTQAISFTESISPATVYIGKSASPALVVKATIPSSLATLITLFGIKSASATGTFPVVINGAAKSLPFTYPRTDLPGGGSAFAVTIKVPLPKLAAPSLSKVTYSSGANVAVALTGYNQTTEHEQSGDSVGSISATCTLSGVSKTIGTITHVKAPTKTKATAAYGKAKKRVTASAKVTASSGALPSGDVTFSLYRNGTKIRTASVSLAGGSASKVFGGVHRPGSYKVVADYAGAGALRSSSASKSFKVR